MKIFGPFQGERCARLLKRKTGSTRGGGGNSHQEADCHTLKVLSQKERRD